MPCSAARWWKGIKQASLAQMTHDMVLRPGPLFMASHVSGGLLPWGAPQPLSANLAQPVLRANITPGRCTKGNTIHSRNSDQHNVEACTCDQVVRRNQIEFLIEKVFLAVTSQLLHCWKEANPHTWSATSEELTSYQAEARPLPGTHCLFYSCLWCGKGCEIWRESEEEVWCVDLNTFSL